MKPGLYEYVNSPAKPHIVAALEGRRLAVYRTKADDGWVMCIKRVKKPIAGVKQNKHDCGDIAINVHTERTVAFHAVFTDEGLTALRGVIELALMDKDQREKLLLAKRGQRQ